MSVSAKSAVDPLAAVFRHVCEAGADALDVDRVGVWLFADDGRELRCADVYERVKRAHSAGAVLRVEEFPEYFAALGRRRTVPAEVALIDPRTSRLAEAYLLPLGISSMLDAAIRVHGELVGVLCHEQVGPVREWTEQQRAYSASMADLLALRIGATGPADLRAALRGSPDPMADPRRAGELAETAAGVAHDFNNILTVLIGTCELIAADPTCPSPLAALAAQAAATGQRGTELARMLMDLARPGPTSPRVVRPAEVVAHQFPELQAAAGGRHPMSLEMKSAAGRVLIDPAQLERVLLNLVLNARDAMPAGGPIGVAVDTVSEPGGEHLPGEYVRVGVRDEGVGIPADVLPRIFEPFFTTKSRDGGTGVGLSVVRQAVGRAGGFVRVETAPGQGSLFRVYLPRVSSA